MSPWSSCLYDGTVSTSWLTLWDRLVGCTLTADADAHTAAQDNGEEDRGRWAGEDLVREGQR